jgi:hypothetical protein
MSKQKILTAKEFLEELWKDPDLSRLGMYTINENIYFGKAVFEEYVDCGKNKNLAKMLFYHRVGRIMLQLPLQ